MFTEQGIDKFHYIWNTVNGTCSLIHSESDHNIPFVVVSSIVNYSTPQQDITVDYEYVQELVLLRLWALGRLMDHEIQGMKGASEDTMRRWVRSVSHKSDKGYSVMTFGCIMALQLPDPTHDTAVVLMGTVGATGPLRRVFWISEKSPEGNLTLGGGHANMANPHTDLPDITTITEWSRTCEEYFFLWRINDRQVPPPAESKCAASGAALVAAGAPESASSRMLQLVISAVGEAKQTDVMKKNYTDEDKKIMVQFHQMCADQNMDIIPQRIFTGDRTTPIKAPNGWSGDLERALIYVDVLRSLTKTHFSKTNHGDERTAHAVHRAIIAHLDPPGGTRRRATRTTTTPQPRSKRRKTGTVGGAAAATETPTSTPAGGGGTAVHSGTLAPRTVVPLLPYPQLATGVPSAAAAAGAAGTMDSVTHVLQNVVNLPNHHGECTLVGFHGQRWTMHHREYMRWGMGMASYRWASVEDNPETKVCVCVLEQVQQIQVDEEVVWLNPQPPPLPFRRSEDIEVDNFRLHSRSLPPLAELQHCLQQFNGSTDLRLVEDDEPHAEPEDQPLVWKDMIQANTSSTQPASKETDNEETLIRMWTSVCGGSPALVVNPGGFG